MVSDSLRQNGGGSPERNPFTRDEGETVYFTPGRTPADWTETRTCETGWDQWPHPENPGLIADVDGYFDWAGRLLFLPDGSPNPEVSGAYRYQTRPDLCDPNAEDGDPASPRYEPMWLRHKPGDTWMIGGKPVDVHDPGPFGNPLWRPDRRTGCHRRGELPDPIPPWEWQPGDPPSPDFARTRIRWDAHGDWTPERIAASGRPEDGAGTIPERPQYQPRRHREAVSAPPERARAEPAPDRSARAGRPASFEADTAAFTGAGFGSGFDPGDLGWNSGACATPEDAREDDPDEPDDRPGAGSPPPTAPDWDFIHRYSGEADRDGSEDEDPRPGPRRRRDRSADEPPARGRSDGGRVRFEDGTAGETPGQGLRWRDRSADGPTVRGRSEDRRTRPERDRSDTAARPDGRRPAPPDASDASGVFDAAAQPLTPLQERAWTDFLSDSRPLYEEHLEPAAPDVRDRLAWFWSWLLWVLAVGLVHRPERPETSAAQAVPEPARARVPVQGRARALPEAARSGTGRAAAAFIAGTRRARTAAAGQGGSRLPHPAAAPRAEGAGTPSGPGGPRRADGAGPRLPNLVFGPPAPGSAPLPRAVVQARPQPSPALRIAKWEQEFDLTRAFARAAA